MLKVQIMNKSTSLLTAEWLSGPILAVFFVGDNLKPSPTLFQNILRFCPNFQIFSPLIPFLAFFALF